MEQWLTSFNLTQKHGIGTFLGSYITIAEISQILISKIEVNLDKLIWKHSASGEYNVAKAYPLIQQLQNPTH